MIYMAEGEIQTVRGQLIPARMLNEYRYCPRLAYIEFVQGDFQDNEHTVEGTRRHRSVDETSGPMPLPEDVFGNFKARGITLSSVDFGIISKLDILESKLGKVSPVEIKKGSGPEEGAWPADIVQIGAQIQILKDNGYRCNEGYIYYSASNKKIRIEYNDDVLIELITSINGLQSSVEKERIPPPLVNSRKCEGCSLAGICLPDETALLEEITDEKDIRCLYPARDDAYPVILNEQGSSLTKSGDELVIKKKGEKIGNVRILDVSHVCIYGNVQVTTQALSELIERNIPVLYFSYGGWFKGLSYGFNHKNIQQRMKQFSIALDREQNLTLAKQFIIGKVKNCRTMLRRNCSNDDVTSALDELSKMIKKIERSKDPDSLLGIEGNSARIYFGNFSKMIKKEMRKDFDFKSRNRRPPRDPVNALLSLCYSSLSKDLVTACLSVGLDPLMGYYHRPRYGRPALALDLMEEFRPLISDSVVISVINNEEIVSDDFIFRGDACNLTDDGRRKYFRAYERRLNTLVKHPLFGYQVSYRRIIELQARILTRFINGEIERYIPFTTR